MIFCLPVFLACGQNGKIEFQNRPGPERIRLIETDQLSVTAGESTFSQIRQTVIPVGAERSDFKRRTCLSFTHVQLMLNGMRAFGNALHVSFPDCRDQAGLRGFELLKAFFSACAGDIVRGFPGVQYLQRETDCGTQKTENLRIRPGLRSVRRNAGLRLSRIRYTVRRRRLTVGMFFRNGQIHPVRDFSGGIGAVAFQLFLIAVHQEGMVVRIGLRAEGIIRINRVFLSRQQIAGVVLHTDGVVLLMIVIGVEMIDPFRGPVFNERVFTDCFRMSHRVKVLQRLLIDFRNAAVRNDFLMRQLVGGQGILHL